MRGLPLECDSRLEWKLDWDLEWELEKPGGGTQSAITLELRWTRTSSRSLVFS